VVDTRTLEESGTLMKQVNTWFGIVDSRQWSGRSCFQCAGDPIDDSRRSIRDHDTDLQ
jgi:hypothetical protein